MNDKSHAISWFEIPTEDLERAIKFYESIFNIKFTMWENNESIMAVFPSGKGMISGALVQEKIMKFNKNGNMVYLNANPDLQIVVDKLEQAGGELLTPKMLITKEVGYMAYFRDTEGNTIGLHSDSQS